MIQNHYEPGDVRIVKMTLSNASKSYSVDIRAQSIMTSIYEDIEQPTMMVEILMQDSINLVQDFPIVGEEVLDITYFTPGRDEPTRLTFMIYSVEGTIISPTSKSSSYTLKGVSPIHFYNSTDQVMKSYNTTISEMVNDIIRTAASKTSYKETRLYVEQTRGLIPITIPRMSPFEAIDFLRQRAVSAEYAAGGAFVFFENQFGLQFRSIENMIKESKTNIASKEFTYQPGTNADNQRSAFQMRNIINYTHLGKFDTISKLNSGTLATEVESFDLLTKTIEKEVIKLSENAGKFASTENKGKLPNTNEFISKFERGVANKITMMRDSSKGNDFIHTVIGTMNAFSTLINQNAVRVLVYGDNYLSVGDLVKLKLPEVSGTTDRKNDDRLNAGNYLVTKLRHIITTEEGGKPKHKVAMDCIRIGYK